jgi:hypothetical protein
MQLALFKHRLKLTQVDIKAPENAHLKELYHSEILVVFLGGQYLCKHGLVVVALERRLRMLEHWW